MKKKTITLFAICFTAIATGVLSGAAPADQSSALVAQGLATAAGALIYVWYKQDLLQRQFRTSTEFNGLVILLTPLALPIYFLRSRGVIRGLVATLLLYLTMVGWVALVIGSTLLTVAARAA